jgi:hypothetical protein
VTRHFRPVTAPEYDAAARAAPAHCPLLAAGDRRSGRQLLADAADDARQDPAAAWRTARGARCRDTLAARLGRWLAAMAPPAAAAAAGRSARAGGGRRHSPPQGQQPGPLPARPERGVEEFVRSVLRAAPLAPDGGEAAAATGQGAGACAPNGRRLPPRPPVDPAQPAPKRARRTPPGLRARARPPSAGSVVADFPAAAAACSAALVGRSTAAPAAVAAGPCTYASTLTGPEPRAVAAVDAECGAAWQATPGQRLISRAAAAASAAAAALAAIKAASRRSRRHRAAARAMGELATRRADVRTAAPRRADGATHCPPRPCHGAAAAPRNCGGAGICPADSGRGQAVTEAVAAEAAASAPAPPDGLNSGGAPPLPPQESEAAGQEAAAAAVWGLWGPGHSAAWAATRLMV